MSAHQQRLTDAQEHLVVALDDAAEHVAWEFDPDEYDGVGASGFAHIGNIDGRKSFVTRVKALADTDRDVVRESSNGYRITVGPLELGLREDLHRGGYRLSITNVSDFRPGPEHQRIDVRERLHRLVLERLQYEWGYLDDARVRSRMD